MPDRTPREGEVVKVGSLFSGYGGLDVAVEQYFNAETVWHAEFEEAPSKVLATHWPGVPNHHDVSQIDWLSIEPVDIITGGFPCQDVSMAGKRAGMTEGTRSNLWGAMRTAIEVIRPQYAVIENVRGLLSATAQSDSDMEPGTGLMGDGSDLNLRALGRVLGDLADIGYDAQWHGLRAADIGAPHGRYRIFILAWDTTSGGRDEQSATTRCEESAGPVRRSNISVADTGSATFGEHSGGSFAEEAGTISGDGSSDLDRERSNEIRWQITSYPEFLRRDQGRTTASGQEKVRRASSQSVRRRSVQTLTDPEGWGWGHAHTIDQRQASREVNASGNHSDATSRAPGTPTQWGAYEPAIRRWRRALGRPAPAPTELTERGRHRLSPAFVEWMMGLPQGWVTDHDLSRADQLKMLGNGVVPQQALRALQHMTEEGR